MSPEASQAIHEFWLAVQAVWAELGIPVEVFYIFPLALVGGMIHGLFKNAPPCSTDKKDENL